MENTIYKDWTVKQTLDNHSQAVGVFFRFKTNCVGCWLTRFCTLEEVAKFYQLDLDDFLRSMRLEENVSSREE
jgi:hybrid cluster-associated redox disulfide protein